MIEGYDLVIGPVDKCIREEGPAHKIILHFPNSPGFNCIAPREIGKGIENRRKAFLVNNHVRLWLALPNFLFSWP